MRRKPKVQFFVLLLVWLVISVPSPAYAYGDPSGGLLFQVITPILTGLWAMWMIFADSVRKRLGRAIGRIRGTAADDTAVSDAQNTQLGD